MFVRLVNSDGAAIAEDQSGIGWVGDDRRYGAVEVGGHQQPWQPAAASSTRRRSSEWGHRNCPQEAASSPINSRTAKSSACSHRWRMPDG